MYSDVKIQIFSGVNPRTPALRAREGKERKGKAERERVGKERGKTKLSNQKCTKTHGDVNICAAMYFKTFR
jgi:hypothetical protein